MDMDEVAKKLAALGLPGIILLITTAATGGAGGSAGLIAVLTTLGGPLGAAGGLGLLGLATIFGDVIAKYGLETILGAVYTERSKTESINRILKEIKDLPISEELKLKLENELSKNSVSHAEASAGPRTVEIVEE